MERTFLASYLLVRIPWLPGEKHFVSKFYHMLDQLVSLSGRLEFTCEEFESYYPEISIINYPEEKDILDIYFPNFDLKSYKVIKVATEVSLMGDFKEELSAQDILYSITAEELLSESARSIFTKRIYDLIMSVNLVSLGSIGLHKGIVLQDGIKYSSTDLESLFVDNIRRAVILSQSIRWPNLKESDLLKTWNWILKQKGFLDGFSYNPVDRALNAYSRLFHDGREKGPFDLFWALMGIEALYVKGKVSITEQVREKAQILLGKQEIFKKKISHMYNFRSRFIHGDLNFSGKYVVYDGSPNFEQYQTESSESSALAIAILVGTIQELVERDWRGLDLLTMLAQFKFKR